MRLLFATGNNEDAGDIIEIQVSNPYCNKDMAEKAITGFGFKDIEITPTKILLTITAGAHTAEMFTKLIHKLLWFEAGLVESDRELPEAL